MCYKGINDFNAEIRNFEGNRGQYLRDKFNPNYSKVAEANKNVEEKISKLLNEKNVLEYDDIKKILDEEYTIKNIKSNNILGKPIKEWNDTELQRAIDSIHNAQFANNKRAGGLSPITLTISEDSTIIVSQARSIPGPKARAKAQEIFGEDVVFVNKGVSSC